MTGGVEMARGVSTRRTIATADMTTVQAEPEMNPRHAPLQALFATKCARGNGVESAQVLTTHVGPLMGGALPNSTALPTLDRACEMEFPYRIWSHFT